MPEAADNSGTLERGPRSRFRLGAAARAARVAATYRRAMTQTSEPDPSKPTGEWVTGDEPMTGPQHSYLQTLAREAGEELPEGLTKAQASELIERLQEVTGRGRPAG